LTLTLAAVAAVLLCGAFVWSGTYNVGADDPHTRPMLLMMQTLRARSIHVRAASLQVPNLEDPGLILKGAGQYAAMCTGCHLAPGLEDSEIRPGLYPQPPDLSKEHIDPKDAFWVIKHGIKMSAMPAWGLTHDDPTIWSMVAFLQKLPTLTPAQYKEIVARAPPDDDMDGGAHHHGDAGADHGGAMPGMPTSGDDAATLLHDHDDTPGHSHDKADGQAEAAPSMEGLEPAGEPAAEAAAKAFHAALQDGDRTAALALLAPEASISEGGQTQSRSEYAAGHLAEDIAFLESAHIKPLLLGSMPMGPTAMVGSRSEIRTTHDGQPIALLSTEMLTLKQTPAGWLITRVEWASQRMSK
jgi:mono/diheme cytochrome c family protein